MPELPIHEKAMPMDEDIMSLDSGASDMSDTPDEPDTDPVDEMLRSALRGGHFLILPGDIPKPPGMVAIVPLPEDMPDLDTLFAGGLPPGVEEVDLSK